jgi:hypothetical protein
MNNYEYTNWTATAIAFEENDTCKLNKLFTPAENLLTFKTSTQKDVYLKRIGDVFQIEFPQCDGGAKRVYKTNKEIVSYIIDMSSGGIDEKTLRMIIFGHSIALG